MSVKKTAAIAVATVASGLALAAPAFAYDEIRTDLVPGDVVRDVGISLVVPQPGDFTYATAELQEDGSQSLGALTQEDGTVILADVGADAAAVPGSAADIAGGSAPLDADGLLDNATPDAAPTAPAAAAGACDDGAYKLQTWTFSDGSRKHPKWKSTFNWHFKSGSTPNNVGQTAARDAIARAVTNITGSHNNCGLADEVSATSAYQGSTTTGTNLSSDGSTCLASDSKSVVAFGSLQSGTLAAACTWGTYDTGTYAKITKSDVRINKGLYGWYANEPSGCSTRWAIEGVMTHEFGHSFGLGHVGEADHGNLTMSTHINGPCQNSEASLGLGDVRGLRVLY